MVQRHGGGEAYALRGVTQQTVCHDGDQQSDGRRESKFLMGSVSDRSNARKFLPLGLILSALAMAFMVWPIQAFDLVTHPENKIRSPNP